MTWSTSQLAELAGTTLKTVRHYHQIGLLDEPERAANGYKRYGVQHLVRLLRIRRLVDLGLPLSAIPSVEAADDSAERVLRVLDAELAASIERQQRMRRELAAILENRASIDLPAEFETLADGLDDLPEAQRALLLAYSSILTPSAMSAIQEQLSEPRSDVAAQFEALPADAPEQVRRQLARRLLPEVRRQQEGHPFLGDLAASSRRGGAVTRSVVAQALVEFYNEAQLDVLRHVHALLAEDEAAGA
ncbi:MerR family transcriptional regulator [Streptomyces lanatus]|uniref:MerR family transcriptional regulator n=1 Tax=Streptomyces lanatus TaxID=66900 RepID=A0ABV1XJJ8_9ACTN|nr:MerR family transcriptional regulator [Streptomyces lanatus]GHG90855.1 transcriptional regulator, MerR family protein [Streptomyces lanatus]